MTPTARAWPRSEGLKDDGEAQRERDLADHAAVTASAAIAMGVTWAPRSPTPTARTSPTRAALERRRPGQPRACARAGRAAHAVRAGWRWRQQQQPQQQRLVRIATYYVRKRRLTGADEGGDGRRRWSLQSGVGAAAAPAVSRLQQT